MTTDPATDERFELALRDLLAERGRATNGDVRSVLAGIEHLPDQTTGRRSWLAAAAAIAVLVVGGGLALGRVSLPGFSGGDHPVGRTAFAGDPRLAACESDLGDKADQVFEMTHADWYPLYFPDWLFDAPELDSRDPALVVIGPTSAAADPATGPTGQAEGTPPTVTGHAMCIAVGAAGNATLNHYGPPSLARIVPVLSDADIARAAHLDPDVLADPGSWSDATVLAPCGGRTGNERWIFVARSLHDFSRHFPAAAKVPAFDVDAPAIVVVYRDPLPVPRPAPVGSPNPDAHDICVILRSENAQPDHMLLLDVDTTGFHVRLGGHGSGSAPPEQPSAAPVSPTPVALGPWAHDAAAVLACQGPPSTIGPTGPQDFDRPVTTAAATIDAYLEFVRSANIPFPTSSFGERERATGARLFTYDAGGRTKAAIILLSDDGTESGRWLIADVASCDPSEYDPRTPVGGGIHVWTDASGNPVRTDEVLQRDDCYGAKTIAVRGRLYLKDPSGAAADAEQLDGTYAADVKLPKGALWLGYLDGTWAIWSAADGMTLYIVGANDAYHAERLPHVKGDEIQRIDCN
jgi:hypothetical protein